MLSYKFCSLFCTLLILLPDSLSFTISETKVQEYVAYRKEEKFGLEMLGQNYPCLLAQFDIKIVIRKIGEFEYPNGLTEYLYGDNLDSVSISGYCLKHKSSALNLNWSTGNGDKFELGFDFFANPDNWFLKEVTLKFQPAMEEELVASGTNFDLSAPMGRSFSCDHELSTTLNSIVKSADITVELIDFFKIQPFQVPESGEFSNAFQCDQSSVLPNVDWRKWPIFVIFLLGTMIIGILIVYSALKELFFHKIKQKIDDFL